jgi:PiT family inorganic phosphate transporter
VILGAGLTVFVTANLGVPISTTHSLTGALVGAGWIAIGENFGFSSLGKNFFMPLILSPFIAVAITSIVYPVFRIGRQWLKVNKETCLCVGQKVIPFAGAVSGDTQVATSAIRSFDIFVDQKERCEAKTIEIYSGKVLGIEAQKILDFIHFLSAGAVSFARGLNDTPKIAALSVTAGALGLGLEWNIVLVAFVMAVGGLVSGRKIAHTMSHRITSMNHGQGFSANLVTAFLVIFASRFGWPVSTTHVSCGALFGIGLVNGKARWKTIGGICSAWVLTLPVAALISGTCYWASARFLT